MISRRGHKRPLWLEFTPVNQNICYWEQGCCAMVECWPSKDDVFRLVFGVMCTPRWEHLIFSLSWKYGEQIRRFLSSLKSWPLHERQPGCDELCGKGISRCLARFKGWVKAGKMEMSTVIAHVVRERSCKRDPFLWTSELGLSGRLVHLISRHESHQTHNRSSCTLC